MADRIILHSDLNCFYASVEVNENPKLRDQAIAVCGSAEERHGIVLTASYPAKRRGVKTGMANWQAVRACPGLICVPPHYCLSCANNVLIISLPPASFLLSDFGAFAPDPRKTAEAFARVFAGTTAFVAPAARRECAAPRHMPFGSGRFASSCHPTGSLSCRCTLLALTPSMWRK